MQMGRVDEQDCGISQASMLHGASVLRGIERAENDD